MYAKSGLCSMSGSSALAPVTDCREVAILLLKKAGPGMQFMDEFTWQTYFRKRKGQQNFLLPFF